MLSHLIIPAIDFDIDSHGGSNRQRTRDEVDRIEVPSEDLPNFHRRRIRELGDVPNITRLSSTFGEQDCGAVVRFQ